MTWQLVTKIPSFAKGIGLIIFSFFVVGWLFPDYAWSTHYLAFVPTPLIFVGGALILMSLAIWNPNVYARIIDKTQWSYPRWLLLLAISLFVGMLMWLFPITNDFYGDAYMLNEHLYKPVPSIPDGTHEAFFHFGLSPWDGQRTILSIVTYLAYFGGTNYQSAFVTLDVFCGIGFVFLWLWYIERSLENRGWKMIMAIAVVSGPFMLNFFGHIEIYAPVLWSHSAFLLALFHASNSRKKKKLLGLGLLYLVCLKLHPIAILYAPALVLVIIHQYAKGKIWSHKLLSWKGIVLFVLVPIYVAGMVLYFFIFEDHADPRHLQDTAMEFDRLFLPLFSPAPPLDSYNLLSFNHIFDYWAEFFLWSPIAMLLVFGFAPGLRRRTNWSTLGIRLSGLTLILMISFFFVLNPLLSMQIDWDLMCMPVPVFLVFTLALVKQWESYVTPHRILGISLSLAVLNIPFFVVHLSNEPLSAHYVSLGKRIHDTYYEWASINIERGLSISDGPIEEIVARRQMVIDDLRPSARKGIDWEFAKTLLNQGRQTARELKRPDDAILLLEEALTYDTTNPNIHLILMEANFTSRNFSRAYDLSLHLINAKHPTASRAQSIAVNCALEAGLTKEALSHVRESLKIDPKNEFMLSQLSLLQQGKYDEARFAFK